MRFKLVKIGKSYAEPEKSTLTIEAGIAVDDGDTPVLPIIWETGNINQIHSLLVLREAEIVLAKTQLTGSKYNDWSTHNRIRDLEIKIADLRRWLTEVMGKDKGDGY